MKRLFAELRTPTEKPLTTMSMWSSIGCPVLSTFEKTRFLLPRACLMATRISSRIFEAGKALR
eukprot:4550552-Heterocapsa_arctica.AAC.1